MKVRLEPGFLFKGNEKLADDHVLPDFVGLNHTVTQTNHTVSVVGDIFFVGYQHNGVAICVDLTEDVHDLV
jgi:hypothetical protein